MIDRITSYNVCYTKLLRENYKETSCYYEKFEQVDDATIEQILKIEKIDKNEKEN